MKLLIVRHAIAADQLDWAETGHSDHLRPLTDKGRERMKRNTAGIAAAAAEVAVIATSPFTRAAQTADILDEGLGGIGIEEVEALGSGGSREELLEWLRGRDVDSCVALVGHEPDLGWLVAWALGGDQLPALPMRKGGACLIDFPGYPRPGRGELKWFLPPRLLRKMAGE